MYDKKIKRRTYCSIVYSDYRFIIVMGTPFKILSKVIIDDIHRCMYNLINSIHI
jgi:hypothetical protein